MARVNRAFERAQRNMRRQQARARRREIDRYGKTRWLAERPSITAIFGCPACPADRQIAWHADAFYIAFGTLPTKDTDTYGIYTGTCLQHNHEYQLIGFRITATHNPDTVDLEIDDPSYRERAPWNMGDYVELEHIHADQLEVLYDCGCDPDHFPTLDAEDCHDLFSKVPLTLPALDALVQTAKPLCHDCGQPIKPYEMTLLDIDSADPAFLLEGLDEGHPPTALLATYRRAVPA